MGVKMPRGKKRILDPGAWSLGAFWILWILLDPKVDLFDDIKIY
jgi:hypothetical protein